MPDPDQALLLRHRAFDLPLRPGEISLGFELRDRMFINLMVSAEGGEETWTFSLSHPPEALRSTAAERDFPPLLSRRARVGADAMRWLPLPAVIADGAFPRVQEAAGFLETGMRPDRYYAFVSHRWLSPDHPDPEGQQARLTAWHLFAALCEAVWVARHRGLRRPRLETPLGFAVGPQGSDLAESIIVNVLRQELDDGSLARAAAEARTVLDLTTGQCPATAVGDAGLLRFRGLLAARPVLSGLLDRFSAWYDYSCLPQSPRTGEEEALFRGGIAALQTCQFLAITVILLDDAEDYLTRAWCTLEALTADFGGQTALLPGSGSGTAAPSGSVEAWFGNLMQDRPHIVWRALLDTEVFGVQDARACLDRLSLTATDASDLPFIYRELCRLGAPRRVHTGDCEVVTGSLPLPERPDGRIIAAGTSRSPRAPVPDRTASLDWTGALRLADWQPGPLVPFWLTRFSDASSAWPRTHLALISASEGEAVLVTGWLVRRIGELEAAARVRVTSVSWTASDVAPVGHFAEGVLTLRGIDAPVLVIAAMTARFEHDALTAALEAAAAVAGQRVIRVVLDLAGDNVGIWMDPGEPGEREKVAVIDPRAPRAFPGGLFRGPLADILSGGDHGRRRR